MLSKEKTEFPEVGNVRTISVLPAVFKVFERIVLNRLKEELSSNPLHPAQTGFTEGKSTMHNVHELTSLVQTARNYALEQRRTVKEVSKRSWQFVAFIDLRKAFDSVNREQLVRKLQQRQLSSQLVLTVENLLSQTTMNYNGHKIETKVGVPQGAVTSPTLFNLYIDDLVQ